MRKSKCARVTRESKKKEGTRHLDNSAKKTILAFSLRIIVKMNK